MNLLQTDIEFIKEKGISEQEVRQQLMMLAEGFPFLKIEASATIGNGISLLTPELQERSLEIWNEFLKKGGTAVKMVPASGAASRMFKDIFAFIDSKHEKPDNDFMRLFFDNIEKFAFFRRLNFMTLSLYGKSVASLIKEKRYKDVARALVNKEGLNYGSLPKALLQFHKVTGTTRTPMEEHLAEAADIMDGVKGKTKVHFTVSEEHIPYAQAKIEETAAILEKEYDTEFDISFSIQKPSTDTIAVNLDNTPYRENGNLLFRPGGHGALIENLNDLDSEVVFIKNIDNIVPDEKRGISNTYKKALAGILIGTKQRGDEYCRILEKELPDDAKLEEMLDFIHNVLHISHDHTELMSAEEKRNFLLEKLNRPMRVCGMVKNEGEPGGGPFLAYNPDGTVSPQILEASQIDKNDKNAMKTMAESTHFNPVDLVCSITDYKGNKFNLPEFIDRATGFISSKSREGVEIKALELPGLWNGAMSDWNTIFIEVPAETFNPVKTVNDLLRPAHQPE